MLLLQRPRSDAQTSPRPPIHADRRTGASELKSAKAEFYKGLRSWHATLIGRTARKALLQMSARKRAGEMLRRALSALKAFEVSTGDVSFKLDVDAAVGIADSGDLVEDLRDLLVAVGEAAQESGLGFALILDEIQNLSRDDYEALIMGLHRTKQKGLPVAFVGAGLPLIPSLTAEAKSYAERMFIYTAIGELGEPAARDALIKPAEAQKVSWDEDGVAEVMAYTEGYPYFIQDRRCARSQCIS